MGSDKQIVIYAARHEVW